MCSWQRRNWRNTRIIGWSCILFNLSVCIFLSIVVVGSFLSLLKRRQEVFAQDDNNIGLVHTDTVHGDNTFIVRTTATRATLESSKPTGWLVVNQNWWRHKSRSTNPLLKTNYTHKIEAKEGAGQNKEGEVNGTKSSLSESRISKHTVGWASERVPQITKGKSLLLEPC